MIPLHGLDKALLSRLCQHHGYVQVGITGDTNSGNQATFIYLKLRIGYKPTDSGSSA